MPLSVQIHNTFRSRWCGAYLQSKGFTVIPTVYWGQPQSYMYCFDGIEKGSVVALSTLGVKKEKDFFLQGYNEMLRRIEPSAIICYCEPFPEMKGNIIRIDYAQTNNLSQGKTFHGYADNSCFKMMPAQFPETRQEVNSRYMIGTGGYSIPKGFGGGGGSGFKSPKSGSGKEKADDVPSWAKGNRPYKNENGKQFAKRLCDEQFGSGNYPKGPKSDFNRIQKWGDRGFE